VPKLVSLLQSARKGVRKEAVWTLSNITAGSKAQIQTVIDAGGVSELVKQLEQGEWEVKKEAAWAVSNYTSGGTREQIRFLVTKKAIKPLCDLLECKEPKIALVALDAIRNILAAGEADAAESKFGGGQRNVYADQVEDAEGLDRIERLQEHPNEKVYQKAVEIIEKYFAEDGEGENFGGGAFQQNGQFSFAPSGPAPAFGGAQTPAPFNFGGPAPASFGGPMNFGAPQQQAMAGGFGFGAPSNAGFSF
jgi:importin subunit alpha-1